MTFSEQIRNKLTVYVHYILSAIRTRSYSLLTLYSFLYYTAGLKAVGQRSQRMPVECWWCIIQTEVNSTLMSWRNGNRIIRHWMIIWSLLLYRYTYFVAKQKLEDSQCLLFAHHRPNTPAEPQEPPSCQFTCTIHEGHYWVEWTCVHDGHTCFTHTHNGHTCFTHTHTGKHSQMAEQSPLCVQRHFRRPWQSM